MVFKRQEYVNQLATCAKSAQVREEGKRQVAKFATPKEYGGRNGDKAESAEAGRLSEGVTDGEMVAQGLAELCHVVVAAAAGVVRSMDAYTDVETYDEEVKVVA